MLLFFLLLIPILGLFSIFSDFYFEEAQYNLRLYKLIAFVSSLLNLILSLVIFIIFDFIS